MFNLFHNGQYVQTGTAFDLSKRCHISKGHIQFMAQHKKEVKGYTVEYLNQQKADDKAMSCIIEHLEKYGNTVLIKKELKFLDRLKEMYDLDVKEYKPRKFKLSVGHVDQETNFHDWVITVKK